MRHFTFDRMSKILERLESRKHLRDVAQAMSQCKASPLCNASLLNETVTETKCSGNPANPDGEVAFSCCSTFNCQDIFGTATFDCNSTKFIYADCAGLNPQGLADSYTCNSATTVTCKDNKPVFDCAQFNCVQSDTGYICKQDVDHVCAASFNCESSFTCSAGHVHICPSTFNCTGDSFTCNAGNEPDTTNTCTDKFPYSKDRNGDPGDFFCGNPVDGSGDTDVFRCGQTFSCSPQSEFRCDVEAVFLCSYGNESGEFTCTGKDGFDCRPGAGAFACKKDKPFDCANYDCHATYTNCKSGEEKECSGQEYNCIKGGNNANACDEKPGFMCGPEPNSKRTMSQIQSAPSANILDKNT